MNTKLKWCDPKVCIPPHEVTRPGFMMALVVAFKQDKGWDKTKPALVGYWNEEGKIQLINGTHRRMAAIRANIAVPVVIHSFDFVKSMWGTEGWNDLMESGDA